MQHRPKPAPGTTLKSVALSDVLAYLENSQHILAALREFQWTDPALPPALADAVRAIDGEGIGEVSYS